MAKVIFNRKADFYNSLKRSVDNYFTSNNLKKTGNWELYTKTLVLVPMAIGIYVTLLLVPTMHPSSGKRSTRWLYDPDGF